MTTIGGEPGAVIGWARGGSRHRPEGAGQAAVQVGDAELGRQGHGLGGVALQDGGISRPGLIAAVDGGVGLLLIAVGAVRGAGGVEVGELQEQRAIALFGPLQGGGQAGPVGAVVQREGHAVEGLRRAHGAGADARAGAGP